MRRPTSSRLWHRVGATVGTLHRLVRPAALGATATRERLRTDGGGRPDPKRSGGRPETDERDHLRDLPDGAGCTEIWEHLSPPSEDEADD